MSVTMTVSENTWNDYAALKISTDLVELQVLTEFGPRIASIRIAGKENILFWAKKPETYIRDKWYLRGGHRVWLARGMADESEETYFPDNGVCTVEEDGDAVVIWGALDPRNKTQRGVRIQALADDRFQVDNIVKNCGDMLYSCGLWALSCTLPSAQTKYVIPLGDGSSFDTASIVLFKEWAGHGQKSFVDESWKIEEDAYVLYPQGKENKRMLKTAASCLAMSDEERDITFAIATDYEPQAQYPAEANIALYCGPNNFMVEMETMGALATLKPGQEHVHSQRWIFQNKAMESGTGAELLKLIN